LQHPNNLHCTNPLDEKDHTMGMARVTMTRVQVITLLEAAGAIPSLYDLCFKAISQCPITLV